MTAAITPTQGRKRGRKLRTIETGREISHEEVVLGLIKRTAVTLANAGQCACGAAIEKPKKGRWPARCTLCKADKCRAKSREHSHRTGRTKPSRPGLRGMGKKGTAATLATYTKYAERHRASVAAERKRRKDAGLCQLCGKAPATSRCDTCKAKRAAYKARVKAAKHAA